ncbi:YheC/YheD family protein [Paenisporosarcina sp. TG20]|uniref:YheC/YheD family protein n=1 Tax=Paenisporosarcina sp. TG20 TaxID=1211706 RepID=UPI0003098873|nr:YheC/YheD family protein [Paenisporosarcina sp. TG20]
MFSIKIQKKLDTNVIHVNEYTQKEITINSNKIVLHFGEISKELPLVIDNSLPDNQLSIPQNTFEHISIPDLPYECYFQENDLYLGPVIGFIPQKKFYNNPRKMLMRFSRYDEIQGLIFLFRPKSINKLNNTIEGYYFDPKNKQFIEGLFPFPNVVYNRIPLSKKTATLFKNIFNYPNNINKLKFWSLLKSHSDLESHIPKTMKYKNIESLLQMVESYKSVYLKPYNKAQGRGILHLKKNVEGYQLTDGSFNSIIIKDKKQLKNVLKKKLKGTYIVQQEIFSIISGKKIDFRVYFHKDQNNEWLLSGMESKIAKEGSIISNFINREYMMPGEKALQEHFQLETQKIDQLIEIISDLCNKAITIIENSGYEIGETAIDLIIDEELKIWLLEAQLNFVAEKKLNRSKDEQLVLPTILPAPFIYAKKLSGF